MKSKKETIYSTGTLLQTIGPIIIVAGVIAYELSHGHQVSGWLVSIGGLLGATGILLQANKEGDKSDKRIRKLDRMGFLGLLIYLIAGGFMAQGSGSWIAIFGVATVFYIYSVFVKDRVLRKKEVK